VFEAGHPSPMNSRGFRGSRPFSAANAALVEAGRPPIDWAAGLKTDPAPAGR
jgi:uracil-DNA glycosylase